MVTCTGPSIHLKTYGVDVVTCTGPSIHLKIYGVDVHDQFRVVCERVYRYLYLLQCSFSDPDSPTLA